MNALEGLLRRLGGRKEVTIADSAAGTRLTEDEQTGRVLELSGTLTAPRELYLFEAEDAGAWVVRNGCSRAVTLRPAGGVGMVVPPGVTRHVYCDGTDVRRVESAELEASANGRMVSGVLGAFTGEIPADGTSVVLATFTPSELGFVTGGGAGYALIEADLFVTLDDGSDGDVYRVRRAAAWDGAALANGGTLQADFSLVGISATPALGVESGNLVLRATALAEYRAGGVVRFSRFNAY